MGLEDNYAEVYGRIFKSLQDAEDFLKIGSTHRRSRCGN